MKFSEYIVLAKPGMMMDPLGFLAPYANLQDTLFKQFTVLSNHPAYHGVLALIYDVLAERGKVPGKPTFAREFRELEIFWGLLNAAAGQGILNVTKYKPLIDAGQPVRLTELSKRHPLYLRLSYGTLGHYSGPSTVWGYLHKGGARLSDTGARLAKAYGTRRKSSLKTWLGRWAAGEAIDLQSLLDIADDYAVNMPPTSAEQQVWRDTIDAHCTRFLHTRCLWDNPLSHEELGDYTRDARAYARFFPALQHRFAPLSERLWLIQTFELMAGIVQFIFEREYLTTQYQTAFCFPPDALEDMLANVLGKYAAQYVQIASHQDTKALFKRLQGLSRYREIADTIVAHHVAHQKSKQASPFIDDGTLVVRDRYKPATFAALREELAGAPDDAACLATLAFHYRRDWHFGRAYTFYRYAGLNA